MSSLAMFDNEKALQVESQIKIAYGREYQSVDAVVQPKMSSTRIIVEIMTNLVSDFVWPVHMIRQLEVILKAVTSLDLIGVIENIAVNASYNKVNVLMEFRKREESSAE